jgi:hypothetical protein
MAMAEINFYNLKEDYFAEKAVRLLTMFGALMVTYGEIKIFVREETKNIFDKVSRGLFRKAKKEISDALSSSAGPGALIDYIRELHGKLDGLDKRDRDTVLFLANINFFISELYRLLANERCGISKESEYPLWKIEQDVLSASDQAIGYWAGKVEGLIPIIQGAMKRKNISSKKRTGMLSICKKHEIYSSEDLKKDKARRQKFMDDAKNTLSLFSERRVLEYLKMIKPQMEIIVQSRGEEKTAL